MTLLDKLAASIALVAMSVLLFAVVCPVALTPTAVVQSRTAAPAVTVAPAAVAILLSVVVIAVMLSRFERSREPERVLQPLPVLDRTCVFLC